jgi:putative addiction module component (TIGR02574 family)
MLFERSAKARLTQQGYVMNASIKSLGIDRLPVEERLILVEEIWDSIAVDSAAVPLTDAQRRELQKRIEEDDANPDDVTPWEQVKTSIPSRLRK